MYGLTFGKVVGYRSGWVQTIFNGTLRNAHPHPKACGCTSGNIFGLIIAGDEKLQSSITKLQSSITKLQPSITKLQSSITKLQSSITKLQPSITKLQLSLSQYNTCCGDRGQQASLTSLPHLGHEPCSRPLVEDASWLWTAARR